MLATQMAIVLTMSTSAGAQENAFKIKVTVLYNFGGKKAGPRYPQGFIAQGRDGNLYSTTPYGGSYNDGTVYKVTPAGQLTVLDDLRTCRGASGLTLGTDGDFYGTSTCDGNGYGLVFKTTSAGKMATLYDFSGQNYDAYPHAPPIQARDGNFYGTTAGDDYGNGGTVYKMTPSGDESTLFKFDRTDGAAPADPLIQATDGSFYGTTSSGGKSGACEQYGCGTIFKLTPKGHLTVLHNFGADDGFYPADPLIQGSDQNFYGTAQYGGPNALGVVFKITPKGKFALLHIFKGGSDGDSPDAALVEATDGSFYGLGGAGGQHNDGVIYKITPGGGYSVIYSFDGTNGLAPDCALVQHTNGKLYGVALEGGSYNYGTFYSVDLGLGPFVSLVSTAGQVGRSIEILGQGFTGTTGVSFNGTSAKFNVASDTYLTATVPAGATTGFVTVATSAGKLKSNRKFQVLQ